ncbi:MAG: hypothetical protein NZ699_16240 [Roseiflexus sp.]|nr:hypothetical protein [Roseiflexus sp.]MCS7290672.1 hypothetical protein [Roseiflexus sp.]
MLLVLLTSCGSAATPDARIDGAPSPTASAQMTPAVTDAKARPTSPPLSTSPTVETDRTATIVQPDITPTAAPTAEQASPASPAPDTQAIIWEGLSIPIPPRHLWSDKTPGSDTITNARVLAQGRIVFDRTDAPPGSVELPDGVGFTIVAFSGSPNEWLALVQQPAPAQNPVDLDSITTTEVAGQPAIVYNHLVTGVGDRRTYIVKLSLDRLLIIDDTGYQSVIDGLAIVSQ